MSNMTVKLFTLGKILKSMYESLTPLIALVYSDSFLFIPFANTVCTLCSLCQHFYPSFIF